MKTVYVMFESRSDNWSIAGDTDWFENYTEKFIGVFGSYDFAKRWMDEWSICVQNNNDVKELNADKLKCEIVIKPEKTPYGFEYMDSMKEYDYKITYKRWLSNQIVFDRDS